MLTNFFRASLVFSILVVFFLASGIKHAESKHANGPVMIQTVFCKNEEAVRGFKNIYTKVGQKVIEYLNTGGVPGCVYGPAPFDYETYYEVIHGPSGKDSFRVFKGRLVFSPEQIINDVFMLCPVYTDKEPQHICKMPGEDA